MLKLVDTSYDIWIHTGLTSFGLDGHWTPFGEGRPQDSNGQQQASDSLDRLFVTTSQRARSGNDRKTIRDNKKEALEKSKPAPSHRAPEKASPNKFLPSYPSSLLVVPGLSEVSLLHCPASGTPPAAAGCDSAPPGPRWDPGQPDSDRMFVSGVALEA